MDRRARSCQRGLGARGKPERDAGRRARGRASWALQPGGGKGMRRGQPTGSVLSGRVGWSVGGLEHLSHSHGVASDLKRLRLTLLQRLNIAVNVADAMDYLHNNCEPPIVHCDLKPGNVLLNADFVACVGDFGIAKILSDSDGDPVTNSSTFTGIRGTVGYVPPEYGECRQVSSCGDVFSFGVTLLEMFTGKAPTDAMFKDGLTVQGFVEIAFPEKLMDIVDPVLLSTDERFARKPRHRSVGGKEIENAIASVTKLALSCTKLTPSERKPMGDAAAEMRKIRDRYLADLTRANN